ncbi:MAG: SpoIIE family protein phosphatase, partial [Gammaproteobacteria bacterium]
MACCCPERLLLLGRGYNDLATDSLKLLIADDNDTDRLLLKTILEKQGHEVRCAVNGAEAVKGYQEWDPDLVLLDAMMPVMDGLEAARIIKSLSGDNVVPIIFITSLTDAASLVDCLTAGGDDFVSKPYNRIVLGAKIQAHARVGKLYATVQEQRDKIALHREHLLREQEVAKAVFDNIAHNGCIHASNIKYLLSPMAIFNGDMVLVSKKPSGGMFVMLGDFTGHGLPAAIGAMPTAEILYGMTKKGFTMEEILKEINSKLKHILPVGVFCCACMVDMSFHEGLMKVWMGGLPDLMIKRVDHSEVEFVSSQYLPLGVLSDDRFVAQVDVLQMNEGDRLYLWSDGIHEAVNPQGEMFGQSEILRIVQNNQNIDQLFEEIARGVSDFTEQVEQDDDHTMVEITMVREENFRSGKDEDPFDVDSSADAAPMDCVISCELRADALRSFNPLAFLTHFFREVPGLRVHSGKLYTILAELYSNALEHGLLGLSSSLKHSTSGFAQYYCKRDEALRNLQEGHVIITLTCEPMLSGGRLIMRLEDSGGGFDYKKAVNSGKIEHKTEGYCGRGIPLLLTMCESV